MMERDGLLATQNMLVDLRKQIEEGLFYRLSKERQHDILVATITRMIEVTDSAHRLQTDVARVVQDRLKAG